jgi:hypothetical protein
MDLIAFLRLGNTVLEAAIVILIASVLLYGIGSSIRSRVARASYLLLTLTVIAYLGDLLLTQVNLVGETERWLRIQWVGIAFVPSAYLHLSDTLLDLSANRSRARRATILVAYGISAVTLLLVAFTELIVHAPVIDRAAPQLQPGVLFPVFMVLAGALIALGSTWQIQARERSRTATMRRRITYLTASAVGPVISVFPYLVITGQQFLMPPILFWLLQVVGNSLVGMSVFFMTYAVAYFGVNEPDRVVRLRLIKFLARGPLVAIGVLVALVFVDRAGRFLGLPADRATPFVVAGGIVIFQWFILLIKPRLERWFYFGERNEVMRIQELRDRVLTPKDLHQYLESILASVCESLQVKTAFVASLDLEGSPTVELIVGELDLGLDGEAADSLQNLRLDSSPTEEAELVVWDGYWIWPLYNRDGDAMLGILGVETPAGGKDAGATLGPVQRQQLESLSRQAADALEDRVLQQEVFALMEGLLQHARRTQEQRHETIYEHIADGTGAESLIEDREFTDMVWDALRHYWGGPKLTKSPLLRLQVVRQSAAEHQGSAINAMRAVLVEAIESLKPEGNRSMTTAEWILYNILELKFLKRYQVRDVARRLAMSESDLYRKQRVAIEAVARAIARMEVEANQDGEGEKWDGEPEPSRLSHEH